MQSVVDTVEGGLMCSLARMQHSCHRFDYDSVVFLLLPSLPPSSSRMQTAYMQSNGDNTEGALMCSVAPTPAAERAAREM